MRKNDNISVDFNDYILLDNLISSCHVCSSCNKRNGMACFDNTNCRCANVGRYVGHWLPNGLVVESEEE